MMAMWLLAIKAMLADRGKLLTSMLGITFSVVLINLQGGLLLGLLKKASLLVDFGHADIWVGHRHMTNVDMGSFIPERWLQRLRSVDGVERADPYIVMFGQATMPNGRFENVIVVGCDPASLMGNAWEMAEGDPSSVRNPEGILVDVCDADRLGNCKIGDFREINGRRARVVGMTRGIVGFTTNPYVFTTLERARTKYGYGVPPNGCSYFLVKAKPGVDIESLCRRLHERVPDLEVYDRGTYSRTCMVYWLTRTGIGLSFGMAAFLGLLVGLAVVAQTLYASVAERIKEFGTLKAMGADDRCISRFFLAQALGNAFLGSILGLTASWLIGGVMDSPRAPVILTWQVAVASVVVICLVCVAASWLPSWRIRRIDPACVLRS
jgi:putative ABC transport system permease protein